MALLQRATVLLVPSSVEGQPLVVLEALASGLPVVVGEHLHSLPTGVVRAGPTVEDWAKAVDEVLNGNLPPKVDVEPHRAFAVAKRWGELYDSLLKD
jgi:glycosyltransferase involved in cell wall biosynthesis